MRFQRFLSSFATFATQSLASSLASPVVAPIGLAVLGCALAGGGRALASGADPAEEPAAAPGAAAPPEVRATIVVTADRTPEPVEELTDSVTVITAAQLQQSQRPTLAEALREVAGVGIVQSGSAGHATAAFVRGANPAQLLVLVDGMEVNNPFFGGLDLSAFLTSGVERVEILRGPQSPLYGSEAMAGVVNIITGGGRVGGTGEAAFEGGSLSTYRESLQLGKGAGPLQGSLTGARNDSAGQFANDEFRDTQLSGRLRREIGARAALTVHGWLSDSHAGIPFDGETPSPQREVDSTLGVAGATYGLRASPLLDLDLRASFTRRADGFRDPRDPFSQASADRSLLWRASAQDTARFAGQTLVVGCEQRNEAVTASNNHQPALDRTSRTTSLYAQDKVPLGALLVSLGARWDHHSAFGNHFSPRLSAACKLAPAWRVRGAVGNAFRSPSAGELAYPFYGNPGLRPETSLSCEAGVDYLSGGKSLSVTGFAARYRDLITFDPVTFIAANIDRARTRGMELAAAAPLGRGFSARGAYTYLWTRDQGSGLPLFRRPAAACSLSLAYDGDAWGAYASARVVGRRFETDFSTGVNRYNGGYSTADVAAYVRVRASLQLTARVDNVLDRRYAEALAFPAPGRTFHAGLRFGL